MGARVRFLCYFGFILAPCSEFYDDSRDVAGYVGYEFELYLKGQGIERIFCEVNHPN